jgi:hypothetical protein
MYTVSPTRRTRGHAAIATAATQEVRETRAKLLAEAEMKRDLQAAVDAVAQAKDALDRASTLSSERSILDAAMTRLEDLRVASSKDDHSPGADVTRKKKT